MKILKAGTRLKSVVCDTQVMVTRAGAAAVLLSCGGAEMIGMDEQPTAGAQLSPEHAQNTLVGKRYVDALDQVELLCTKGGKGLLALNGAALLVKQAKALPSSD